MPLPHDPGPHWGEVGIHGLHRHREWDAVATVDAPDLVGEDVWFVVLGPGEVVAEDGEIDARLVSSIALAAPFRAHAVRRDAGIWVVGASRIRTVALVDDPGGSSVGRGRLPGAGRALALAYWTDDEEVPCDSRSPCGVDT